MCNVSWLCKLNIFQNVFHLLQCSLTPYILVEHEDVQDDSVASQLLFGDSFQLANTQLQYNIWVFREVEEICGLCFEMAIICTFTDS